MNGRARGAGEWMGAFPPVPVKLNGPSASKKIMGRLDGYIGASGVFFCSDGTCFHLPALEAYATGVIYLMHL